MVDAPQPPVERTWRIPPGWPALLFLLTSGCAAANLYGHPSSVVRTVTALVGLAALVAAVSATRMLLAAGPDGVRVRFLGRTTFMTWPEVERIEVVASPGAQQTVQLTGRDGRLVKVPPSLLQPAAPTGRRRAEAQVRAVAAELEGLRRRGPRTARGTA